MSGSANSSWRAVIVLTVVAAVAGLVFFLLQSSNRGAAGRHPAAPATTATGVRSPLDVSAQIAALQQSLRNLEENRRDLFLKLREARNLEKATNGVWLAEIQQARQELEAALDAHPAVVAAKNEMQRILDEQHITDTNSAAVLTRLHQKQNTRETTFKNNISAIWDRGAEERKKAMVEFGKTDMRKLTEAEAELVKEFMLAAIASAMRQGRQEGFSE